MDLSIRGLDELMHLIRQKGYRALVIVDQGGARPFVGAVMDGMGKMSNQTMSTHATPTNALAQLARSLGGEDACPALQGQPEKPSYYELLEFAAKTKERDAVILQILKNAGIEDRDALEGVRKLAGGK